MTKWYKYYKNDKGQPIFPGVYFSSIPKPIIIVKETNSLVLFKKKGATVYIPRKMVYSSPEYYLIRKIGIINDGYQDYYKTELIKSQVITRKTSKAILQDMLSLMDEQEANMGV